MSARAVAAHGVVLAVAVVLAACSGRSADWFPSPPGAKWRYAIVVQTTELRRQSRLALLGLAPVMVEGRRLERRRVNAGLLHYYERANGGVARVAIQRPEDEGPVFETEAQPVLPLPVTVGSRWRQPSVTRVLETTVDPFRRKYRMEEPVQLEFVVEADDDTVTVPAGRYQGCLRVKATGKTRFKGDKTIFPTDVSVAQTDWYARGVGLVRSERVETTGSQVLPGGRFVMELESFEH